jgi:hypothetical protein
MTRPGPTPFQFFAIVQPPPVAIAAVALLVLAYGVYLTRLNPASIDDVAGMMLFLQVFAASTGYRDRLRRGHFDAILVARPRRASIAWAHWLISIGPGLAIWLTVAALDAVARPHHWPTVLTSAWLVTFFYVSTAAWAATLPFTRLAGGALWVIVLFALGPSGGLAKLTDVFKAGGGTWMAGAQQAGVALVCPFLLVGTAVPVGVRSLVLVGGATVAVWGLGLTIISRCDGTLADPS